MFRSGRLTRTRLNQILGWVEKLPHNLKAVAKACNIYPSDLMAWYAAGQDPTCRDPLMAELAWRVAEIRGQKAAENYARIEVLATEGDFKAVEKLEEMSEASAWEISPDNEQAAELHKMLAALEPTPLLGSGVDEVVVEDRVLDPIQGDVELGAGPVGGVGVVPVRGEGEPERVVGEDGEGEINVVFHDQTLTGPE